MHGGLVVDVGRLGAVTVDAPAKTARIGAGTRLIDVYEALWRRQANDPGGLVPDGRDRRARPRRWDRLLRPCGTGSPATTCSRFGSSTRGVSSSSATRGVTTTSSGPAAAAGGVASASSRPSASASTRPSASRRSWSSGRGPGRPGHLRPGCAGRPRAGRGVLGAERRRPEGPARAWPSPVSSMGGRRARTPFSRPFSSGAPTRVASTERDVMEREPDVGRVRQGLRGVPCAAARLARPVDVCRQVRLPGAPAVGGRHEGALARDRGAAGVGRDGDGPARLLRRRDRSRAAECDRLRPPRRALLAAGDRLRGRPGRARPPRSRGSAPSTPRFARTSLAAPTSTTPIPSCRPGVPPTTARTTPACAR